MEQRRKIIIPTGTDPEETLSAPHFDNEATLSARPVVPLAEPVALPPEDVYRGQQDGLAYAPTPTTPASPWKRSTLILIILAAVGLGVASGLAIGLYQSSRTKSSAPVVAQPSTSGETEQVASQPEPQLEQPPVVSQPETRQPEPEPEEEAQIPSAPSDEEPERRRADDSDEDEDNRATRENRKRDETRAAPPVARDRPGVNEPDIDERDVREERRARREERKEQRREERRAARRRQREDNEDTPLDFPRNVERARQEINRIRDIFEGRQP